VGTVPGIDMVLISPWLTAREGLVEHDVEALGRQVAVEILVELDERGTVADAEASVDDLDRQLAVGRGVTVSDTVPILQMLDEAL
jgi:hypothetical protein